MNDPGFSSGQSIEHPSGVSAGQGLVSVRDEAAAAGNYPADVLHPQADEGDPRGTARSGSPQPHLLPEEGPLRGCRHDLEGAGQTALIAGGAVPEQRAHAAGRLCPQGAELAADAAAAPAGTLAAAGAAGEPVVDGAVQGEQSPIEHDQQGAQRPPGGLRDSDHPHVLPPDVDRPL